MLDEAVIGIVNRLLRQTSTANNLIQQTTNQKNML